MNTIKGLAIACLMLLLSACPGVGPSFELSVLNDDIDMIQGQSQLLQVQALRESGFDAAIKLEFKELPLGFSSAAISIFADENSGQLELKTSADEGSYELILKASSGAIEKELGVNVLVLPPPASITAFQLKDYGESLQLRQGAEAVLELQGENLTELSNLSLEDLTVSLESQSDNEVSIKVLVPHGASLGFRTLSFDAGGNSFELDKVIEVTAIHASPVGLDEGGKGTADLPWRSLTKALSFANVGDRIRLAAGEYSEASGEVWPVWPHGNNLPGLVANDGLSPNTPEGVSIIGEDATTILKGNSVGSYTLGFVPANNVSISNLLMQDFEYAILSSAQNLKLENVRINSSAAALWNYASSSTSVSGESVFSGSFVAAAALNQARLNLLGTSLNFGLFGGLFSEEVTVLLEDVKATNNATGIAVLGNAEVRLKNTVANQNAIGMDISGGSLKVRNSSFSDNQQFGIRVTQEILKLDLGTGSDAGNNALQNNEVFQFLDARPERAQADGTVIEMSDTLLGDSSLAEGAYSGVFVGTNKSLMISFKNNLLRVY